MMRIDHFIGQVAASKGFASPTRYSLEISMMELYAKSGNSNVFDAFGVLDPRFGQRFSLFCEITELPGRNFYTTDRTVYGPVRRVPYMTRYDELQAQFMVGQDMAEKDFFDAWMYCVQSYSSNDYAYPADYTTTITIKQYDEYAMDPMITSQADIAAFLENKEPTYVCHLHDAYPVAVNSMGLSYEACNQYHRLGVSFAYSRWDNQKIERGYADSRIMSYTPETTDEG